MHAVELHLEQLVHRQLAARVGQADDDAVDAARADDRRNVLDRADDAGIDHRRADARRIGVDEADDLDAELVPRSNSSRASATAAGARADEQQPLARRARACVSHSKARRQPSTSAITSSAGDHEHAAADDQAREPEVDGREDERGGAQRLDDARRTARAGPPDRPVVEVGVVQAQLADDRDQQRLAPRRLRHGEHLPRLVAAQPNPQAEPPPRRRSARSRRR